MNTVKRAIIMAAGKGQRMRPLTETIPKPLISVNGTRMIETIIRGLNNQGIYEIYIVVGYLKEKFDYLTQKYDGIKLIENPYYNLSNNISSLYVARDYICSAIILDGDQLIYNSKVLEKNFEKSGYNAVWNNIPETEWQLIVNNNVIKKCIRHGGAEGWQLYSISRWSDEDGKKLKKHLELEFEKNKNHLIYWDDIVLFCYPEEYELIIKKMEKTDVVEIDNLEELKAIDSTYNR